jgi:hypothetical protein
MAEYTDKPPKMYLRDLSTPSTGTVTAQANPETLDEKIKVIYNRAKIPGLSHEPLQFSNTDNWKTTIELMHMAADEAALSGLNNDRKLLMSWCLPRSGGDIPGGSPPRLLFFWPKMWMLTVVITELDISHKRFKIDGESWIRVAKVSIEESRDSRLQASDVASNGTMRSGN